MRELEKPARVEQRRSNSGRDLFVYAAGDALLVLEDQQTNDSREVGALQSYSLKFRYYAPDCTLEAWRGPGVRSIVGNKCYDNVDRD